MPAGVTEAHAALYLERPAWISVVFALGVFGGFIGSVALALRPRMAEPVLVASLVRCNLLFAVDTWYCDVNVNTNANASQYRLISRSPWQPSSSSVLPSRFLLR